MLSRKTYAAATGARAVGLASEPGSHWPLLLYDTGSSTASIVEINAAGQTSHSASYGQSGSWSPAQITTDNTGAFLILWKGSGAQVRVEAIDSTTGTVQYDQTYGPQAAP